MPSLPMFSTLLDSKDRLSWTSVVLVRQGLLLWTDWARITLEGVKVEKLSPLKPLLEQKSLLQSSECHYCSTMGKELTVFLQHFLPPPLLSFSFLSSIFSPSCPLHLLLPALSSTFIISLCFHLLLIYRLNARHSVLTALFWPLLPGSHLHPFCSLPRAFLYANTGMS